MLSPYSLPKPFRAKNLCSFRIERETKSEFVVGIDEVGRGCLAGPVVVAAVTFPFFKWQISESFLDGVTDSKKISALKRNVLDQTIRDQAEFFSIQSLDAQTVDELNILQATFEAARRAVAEIQSRAQKPIQSILMDGPYKIPGVTVPQRAVIGGDQFSKSIAAASILAKVHRDRFMEDQAKFYPEYGFEKNKGYGTSQHLEALKKYGPTPLHRMTFLKKIEFLESGKIAEDRVLKYLESQGYSLFERNWRNRFCEIDLVITKHKELRFVEVRYRKQETDIDLVFPPSKQQQVKSAVEYFMSRVNPGVFDSMHVDLALVTGSKIEYLKDVFSV